MCWASGNGVSPSRAGFGLAMPGEARRGEVWFGGAWQGKGHRRWHGGLRPSLPPSQGWICLGTAGLGMVRRGGAWAAGHVTARAADGSTGGFGSHCCSLRRADAAGPGAAWPGVAWMGRAGLGAARAADSSTELLWRLPAALIRGQTRQDQAWHAAVRHGSAGHGSARADDLSTEGASPPCWVHSTHLKA